MLNQIEKTVLRALLEHEPSIRLEPGAGIDAVEVASRCWTGVGFLTELADAPVHGPTELEGPASGLGVQFRGRLNDAVDFGVLLYFSQGRLTALEGFTYGEAWPEDVDTVTHTWGDLSK